MKEHLRLVDNVRQGHCFLFRDKTVEIARLLSICSGSMMSSNFYTLILFRYVIRTCCSVLYYWHTEAAVWHQTVIEKKEYNTFCWCVYYSGFQCVRQVTLNYYLSQGWKQFRQCWQTYPGVIILNLKVKVLFVFSSVILFKDKHLK